MDNFKCQIEGIQRNIAMPVVSGLIDVGEIIVLCNAVPFRGDCTIYLRAKRASDDLEDE